jgi:hypothetical protein
VRSPLINPHHHGRGRIAKSRKLFPSKLDKAFYSVTNRIAFFLRIRRPIGCGNFTKRRSKLLLAQATKICPFPLAAAYFLLPAGD